MQAKIEKVKTRTANLIAMRADGEITKEEYQTMRTTLDNELKQLQNQLDSVDVEEHPKKGLKLDEIITTLNSVIDFSSTKISHDVINQFVYMVIPTSDTIFSWYVNLRGEVDIKAAFTAEGRKNRAVIKLEKKTRVILSS